MKRKFIHIWFTSLFLWLVSSVIFTEYNNTWLTFFRFLCYSGLIVFVCIVSKLFATGKFTYLAVLVVVTIFLSFWPNFSNRAGPVQHRLWCDSLIDRNLVSYLKKYYDQHGSYPELYETDNGTSLSQISWVSKIYESYYSEAGVNTYPSQKKGHNFLCPSLLKWYYRTNDGKQIDEEYGPTNYVGIILPFKRQDSDETSFHSIFVIAEISQIISCDSPYGYHIDDVIKRDVNLHRITLFSFAARLQDKWTIILIKNDVFYLSYKGIKSCIDRSKNIQEFERLVFSTSRSEKWRHNIVYSLLCILYYASYLVFMVMCVFLSNDVRRL